MTIKIKSKFKFNSQQILSKLNMNNSTQKRVDKLNLKATTRN